MVREADTFNYQALPSLTIPYVACIVSSSLKMLERHVKDKWIITGLLNYGQS